MTAEQVAKQKKKVEMNLDEYEENLNDLWCLSIPYILINIKDMA